MAPVGRHRAFPVAVDPDRLVARLAVADPACRAFDQEPVGRDAARPDRHDPAAQLPVRGSQSVREGGVHAQSVSEAPIGGGDEAEARRDRQAGPGRQGQAEPLATDQRCVGRADPGEGEDFGHGDRVWEETRYPHSDMSRKQYSRAVGTAFSLGPNPRPTYTRRVTFPPSASRTTTG